MTKRKAAHAGGTASIARKPTMPAKLDHRGGEAKRIYGALVTKVDDANALLEKLGGPRLVLTRVPRT